VALGYVGAMNDMLNATIVRGTGKRAAFPGHIAAGKTGTTQGSRDAWFVGYTAHYVAGVWIGNDDATRMKKVTGGTLPAKLWHDVMLHAHQDKDHSRCPARAGGPCRTRSRGCPGTRTRRGARAQAGSSSSACSASSAETSSRHIVK
jgi:penicillin-binding protein 1A